MRRWRRSKTDRGLDQGTEAEARIRTIKTLATMNDQYLGGVAIMDVASKLPSLREEVEAIYFANKLAVGTDPQ
jgi:hypothetical protein